MSEKPIPTREELKKLKVVTLRQRLSKLSLPQGGLKDDLITRLLEHYQQAAAEAKAEQQAEADQQQTAAEGAGEEKGEEEMEVVEAVREGDGGEEERAEQPQEQGGKEMEGEKEERGEEQPQEQEGKEREMEGNGGEGEREEQSQEQGGKEREMEGENGERGEEIREGEEGEKMELSEDAPAQVVEEADQLKESRPLTPREDEVREEKTSLPPPLMGATGDQPRPLMDERPPESRPLMEAAPTQPRPLMETVVEKPRPLMSSKPPQVTSDYHSASDTPREEERVAMATANHTGPIANSNDKPSAASVSDGPKEEGKKKKKKKRRRRRHDQPTQPPPQPVPKSKDKVEVEYIQEDILKPDDPYFRTFFRVFETFRIQEPEVKKHEAPPNVSDLVAKAALESKRLAAQRQDDSDDEEEEGDKEQPKISKKKLRRMNRLSVAQLKQLVERPDVVEMHDVTAPDPKLLIHLKSTRNTVPVPRHWCFKRKYLQGKRGIEKPPFDLPDFIKATGVMDMRQALEDKEDAKSLKQKTRERVRPKMGKLTIDYQKLHDAFFKWQTKPKMSIHGDLYYEGKEFETRLRQKKPGDLSDELRRALGMPTGLGKHRFPPPWLVAMQRYGPPPSYPNLKIPGLNNPIPEGCSFGYFVGGWGKPPVDERGRPLYGDVFGLEGENTGKGRGRGEEEDVDQALWGELESEEEEEESEEEEEEEERSPKPEDIQAGLITPVEGLATPSGLTSIPAGLETPEMIQLRKKKIEEAMEKGGETPALYTVLPEKTASVGGAMMGSSHVYDMASAVPGALKKTLGSSHEGIEVTLDPSELDLDAAAMSARYEETLREQQGQLQKEDLSDMVAEHAAKQKKRKRPAADSGGGKAAKKLKEFKF